MFCSRRPLRGETSAFDPKGKHVPLWSWFIAVQWLDVLWSILVLMEIEKLRGSKPQRSGLSVRLDFQKA